MGERDVEKIGDQTTLNRPRSHIVVRRIFY